MALSSSENSGEFGRRWTASHDKFANDKIAMTRAHQEPNAVRPSSGTTLEERDPGLTRVASDERATTSVTYWCRAARLRAPPDPIQLTFIVALRCRVRFARKAVAIAHAFLGLALGCNVDEHTPYQADAVVYVRAHCETICGKYETCAPVPESYDECVVAECVEDRLDRVDEPCWAEGAEFSRCRSERETCEDYFDATFQTGPESQCYEFVVAWSECLAEHGLDGSPR